MSRLLLHPALVGRRRPRALTLLWQALGAPVGLITQIAIYTLYGTGVNLLVGYTGLVPFGASVFFGCASYAAALSILEGNGNDVLALVICGRVLGCCSRSSSARSSCAARVSIFRF